MRMTIFKNDRSRQAFCFGRQTASTSDTVDQLQAQIEQLSSTRPSMKGKLPDCRESCARRVLSLPGGVWSMRSQPRAEPFANGALGVPTAVSPRAAGLEQAPCARLICPCGKEVEA